MGIKNFSSHVKSRLTSWHMTLNCTNPMTVHVVKLHNGTQVRTSGCMMLNCPPSMHDAKLQTDDITHGAFSGTTNDASTADAMYRTFGPTNGTSIQTTPKLIRSSSTDSFQTHDSLVTPESPQTYLPSPRDSLVEGASTTQVNDSTEDVQDTQVGMDLLIYDSLITALSQLSLKPPSPDPYQDHQ